MMLATDFAHVDCAVTRQRLYCPFVMEIGSRYVHVPGITASPIGPRTVQQIRNLVMDLGDRAVDFRFLVRDRAGQFTASFDTLLASARRRGREDPAPEPSRERIRGRFALTAQTEVTDRMLIFGQRHLQLVLAQYEARYDGRPPTAAGISTRPASTALSRTSPRSRSSAVPSWAGSSTNTSGPHRSRDQER